MKRARSIQDKKCKKKKKKNHLSLSLSGLCLKKYNSRKSEKG
jgi:hypothetical protein